MSIVRPIGRLLLARSISTTPCTAGIQELFETPLKEGETRTAGRGWKASELRNKSWDDLHKLWYVLLKERLVLNAERERCRSTRERMPAASRLPKVRKSMCNIKMIMTERAIKLEDSDTSTRLRYLINAM